MTDAPDGRRIFLWSGKDRAGDTGKLADAVAESIEGLCNYDGTLVQLDGHGGLSPLNFNEFRELVDGAVCGLRIVPNGSGWQREYFSYRFDPPQRIDARVGGPRPLPDTSAPDLGVLDELYRFALLERLPKVVS